MEPVRERLVSAAVSLVSETGHESVTVAAIAARAETTTSEFGRHFSSADDCCRGAFDTVCDRFDRHLLPIYLRPEPWRTRMRAAARAAIDFCRTHEEEVRFAVEEQLRGPSRPQGERSLRLHLGQIDSVRSETEDPAQIRRSAAEFVVGCFLERVLRCHAGGELAGLERSLPDLMYALVEAFLGPAAAEEELLHPLYEIAPDQPL
jgi:AcrR family transcriptional regulator